MNDKITTSPKTVPAGKPFFSIITPVYNAASYLRECLDSILAQDYSDWELIMVDDGSSDSSVEIAEEYSRADSRIRISRSELNSGGAFTPRHTAATLAEGDYIVTIDADDKVAPDLLSSLYASITHYGTDLVIPEMWRMDGADCHKILPLESVDVSRCWNGKDLVEQTLCFWAIPMCGFAIKKDLYLQAYALVSESDSRSIFADELLSRWLLFLSTSVRFCNSRYFYRYNGGSVTNVDMPRYVASRMRTADSLIAMTAEAFGPNSHTHIRALENKFYKSVDLLRLINSTMLEAPQRKESVRRISTAMKGFDFQALRGRVSPRYLALMRLPVPMSRMALKILDPIFGK